MIRRSVAVVLCAALVIGAAGCAGWFGKEEEKTASELAAEGQAYFEDEKYLKAIEVYENLRDWYPYSKYTKTAELRIADAHYHQGNYEQALAEYEYYESMHPGDKKIPYVIYQIGMCHYERIKSIDRTQVPTKKALEAFSRLRSRFPESRYSGKAGSKIKECREKLAGHEFYVGRFYFKSGHYEAALSRFKNVTENYSNIKEYSEQAGEYIKRCRKNMAEMEDEDDENLRLKDPAGADGPGTAPITPD